MHLYISISISIYIYIYVGTSLIGNSAPLGPDIRNMPRALWWSSGGGLFLMSEVPLYGRGGERWTISTLHPTTE